MDIFVAWGPQSADNAKKIRNTHINNRPQETNTNFKVLCQLVSLSQLIIHIIIYILFIFTTNINPIRPGPLLLKRRWGGGEIQHSLYIFLAADMIFWFFSYIKELPGWSAESQALDFETKDTVDILICIFASF